MPIPHRTKIKKQLINFLLTHGAMATNDVYIALANSWDLSDSEMKKERDGRPLYKNEIRWARLELVEEGIIEKSEISGRGIWQLRKNIPSAPKESDEESSTTLKEGALKMLSLNRYERNKKARKKCLKAHGYLCIVCKFDFESTYGPIGKNCIHVHHIVEISSIGKEYVVDPIKDMVPVCPNCHYIIHLRKPAFSLNEVKALLKANKGH